MKTKRNRPNAWENRYNQWVIAGKIAVKTGAIDPYGPDGKISSVYCMSDKTKLHYSIIGMDYLRQIGVNVNEL